MSRNQDHFACTMKEGPKFRYSYDSTTLLNKTSIRFIGSAGLKEGRDSFFMRERDTMQYDKAFAEYLAIHKNCIAESNRTERPTSRTLRLPIFVEW